MSVNASNRDMSSIRCDLCLQNTNRWIIICEHHYHRSLSGESSSEAEGLSDDSGFGDIAGHLKEAKNKNQRKYQKWMTQSKVNYVLLGTFIAYCQPIEITDRFFYFPYLSLNRSAIGVTYNLRIAFEDIEELLYCSELGNFLCFIEIRRSTNLLIETTMNLTKKCGKGLRFDVNSDGNYISVYVLL